MTFNPTTNRAPWGLLEQHERIALRRWPHGWEWYCYSNQRWFDADANPLDVVWDRFDLRNRIAYRGKPAPANKED